ncbi:MAG: hypothetical protein D6730_12230 [Bacteroidetes bacterium]|nr:MAG: hypothetical protein D6730_12230 [Bacteroidota bacterium]
MKRLHLFEFEDLPWFPAFLRDYGTDFLQFMANQFDFYKGIVPLLKIGLEKSGTSTIIDLASGGGGGWLKLVGRLRERVPGLKIVLTDYYPNLKAFERIKKVGGDPFTYISEPVNALDVPEELAGLRTQFLSFHHFKPEQAQQILQNAVDRGMPIAIFEVQERNWKYLLQHSFSPISVLLTTPFIRPFKWGRLLFTYLLPILPLFIYWDGLVSVLRTYTLEEMEAMTRALKGGERFSWEINRIKSGPTQVLYAFGYPREE